MWRNSNTYRLLIPDANEELVIGWDPDISENWCGYVANVSTAVNIREQSLDRAQSDGAVFGSSWMGSRSVVFDVKIIESDPVERGSQIRKLSRIVQGLRNDVYIRWTEDDGTEREVVGRLSTYPNLQSEDQGPVKTVQLGFTCPDPGIRSQRVWSVDADPGDWIQLDNVGDLQSYPKIWLYGPATRFDLEYTLRGVTYTFTITDLPTSTYGYVELDSWFKTVRLGGTANIWSKVDENARILPVLDPNSTMNMRVLATGGGDDTHLRVDWRHRWGV